MKCPGTKAAGVCLYGQETLKGIRCKQCARLENRENVRKYYKENRERLLDQSRQSRRDSLRWAQDVDAAPTIKTADKMISDAIKLC